MAALGALALLLQSPAGSGPKWLLNVGAEPDYTQAVQFLTAKDTE